MREAGRDEFNAFFPSPYSLGEFTSRTVEIDGDNYQEPHTSCRKILMIAAESVVCRRLEVLGTGHGRSAKILVDVAKGRAEISGGAAVRLGDTRAVSVLLRH